MDVGAGVPMFLYPRTAWDAPKHAAGAGPCLLRPWRSARATGSATPPQDHTRHTPPSQSAIPAEGPDLEARGRLEKSSPPVVAHADRHARMSASSTKHEARSAGTLANHSVWRDGQSVATTGTVAELVSHDLGRGGGPAAHHRDVARGWRGPTRRGGVGGRASLLAAGQPRRHCAHDGELASVPDVRQERLRPSRAGTGLAREAACHCGPDLGHHGLT